MSGPRDSWDYRHGYDRDRGCDREHYHGHIEGGREPVLDNRRDRQGDSRQERYRDPPRRSVPVCYECGEPGHYKNQCPRLVGESSSKFPSGYRGRSTSPTNRTRVRESRSASKEPALRKQLDDLASSLATMKNYIDAEQARKEEKEKERKEKERRRQKEQEREQREEEACLVREKRDEKRRVKKEEAKRKDAEFRESLPKELKMEVRRHVGGEWEELQHRLVETLPKSKVSKGKEQMPVYKSDSDKEDSDNSDVATLNEQAEELAISEKRKRSVERAVGNSPPLETPAKGRTKRGLLDTKRLVLSCRHPAMKRSPNEKTSLRSNMKKKKIPATAGAQGKVRYVTENLQELGGLNVDELKQICKEEEVHFEGKKKMDTILAITEKRTQVAYGCEEHEEETGEDVTEEGFPYPRVGDHVRFRLQELEGVNPLICNANNVPKLDAADRETLLAQEISTGFTTWINCGKKGVSVQRCEVVQCMSKPVTEGGEYLDSKEVEALRVRLDGLVLTPLDGNPGETLVMCPKLYFDAMMKMFVLSSGYTIIEDSEKAILQKMLADVKASGLQKFAKWDSKGKG
ncbi:hypothetical protein CBR_g51419 [Chara braunii]|uniref:CCHC-type domain-containing protein n=1 Tax=Chara braunii TaxID=69332 RepID=A0A388M8X6_CHABU|nr:hypothetical protein CBR_g51419 [Chara braunii]|eukprot:GBG90912.1 hypothetical protein CBR_g51419 [Chara braunii]